MFFCWSFLEFTLTHLETVKQLISLLYFILLNHGLSFLILPFTYTNASNWHYYCAVLLCASLVRQIQHLLCSKLLLSTVQESSNRLESFLYFLVLTKVKMLVFCFDLPYLKTERFDDIFIMINILVYYDLSRFLMS